MDQDFITKDLGIAAALRTLGIKMKDYEWRGKEVYFKFENKHNESTKYAHSYNFGTILVNAKAFHLNLRMLKRLLYENKESEVKTI